MFSTFGRLPFLSKLTIEGMDVVKGFLDNIDHQLVVGDKAININNNAGQLKAFPSLKTLHISDAPNLEGLVKSEGVWEEIFPCLRNLVIKNCPDLGAPPCLHSLQNLTIEGDNMVVLKSVVENLTSLTLLSIQGFWDLVAIPEEIQNLIRLESLEIANCGIASIPAQGLQGLCSLTRLEIRSCYKLTSLSEGVRHLTMLKDLEIDRCPKLTSLPEGMKHLSALQNLSIWNCNGLLSLPECLGNLTSLSSLEIYICKNITSLPEALQHNTILRRLQIISCPHLEQRYKKEIGEDWHKIAHIPNVDIDDPLDHRYF